MSNSYLIGAMLDPLVVEFMPPAYCEAMLEAKIRTDEIRGNCPPRAGYVCVLDPRVNGGRYYRKQVKGEGVNALPPSRIEKALAQQESRSQKGEGISFLGKAAIAGGLAIGGLAAIGAAANSGRSAEPVPDIPNAKVKPPDTSEKPKSSTYEEAKQQALLIGREKRVKPPSEVVENGVIVPKPPIERSPKEARKKRGSVNQESEAIAEKLEILKQTVKARGEVTTPPKPDNEPVPLTKTTQTTPDPEVTPAKKPKEKKSPVDITSMTAREASNAIIRDAYTNIPDKTGAQNIGYKSAFQLKSELTKQGVIRDGAANSRADFEALLDNNMLVEEGLLVQTKTGVGKYGKNNIDAIRVPAFMPVKDLSNAASNIISEGKGGAGITDRVSRAETLIAAITEKLDKAKDLTELERNQLVSDRNRLTDKINVDNAKIKGSVIAEINKPTGNPPPEPPKVESVIAKKIVGADPKAIAKKMEDFNYIREVIDGVSTKDANNVADYLAGLKFTGTAHENKKTIVRGLKDKAKKIATQAPAIAEKTPEDLNTFPLGASVPKTPVVRPEPAKPNSAAASANSPSTPKSSVDDGVARTPEQQKKYDEWMKRNEKDRENRETDKRLALMKHYQARFGTNGLKSKSAKELADMLEEFGFDRSEFSTDRDELETAVESAIWDKLPKVKKKKQNNDAIASHETYYSAKEQARQEVLRRFAA